MTEEYLSPWHQEPLRNIHRINVNIPAYQALIQGGSGITEA